MRNIKSNFLWIIVYMIIVASLTFLYLRHSMKVSLLGGFKFTLADYFVDVSGTLFFGIELMIVNVFLLLHLFKNDFSTMFVLKQKSKKLLWLKEVYKSILFSLFSTIYLLLCTYGVGGLLCSSYINWDRRRSIFFGETNMICSDIKFINVVMAFFIISFIRILVITLLTMLIYWITNKSSIPLIVIITVGIVDYYCPIFYRLISIYYTKWVNPINMAIGLIYGIFLMISIIYVGMFKADRKEFLNE